MARLGIGCILLASLLAPPAAITQHSQQEGFSVELFGAFTTSSRLFPYPNDPNEVRRAFFLSLDDIFHVGAEVRASVSAFDVQLGLSSEYIQKTETIEVPLSTSSVPVRDGYRVIPLELTGYFTLPFGNENIHIYLGGGVGFYAGERIYQYANATANVVGRTGGFGIHVLCGGEFRLVGNWALRTELKARDVQFESVNQFSQPSTVYEGRVLILPQEAFYSRFSVDGLTIRTGIAYTF